MSQSSFRPYRSLFWPVLLIGVGIVWTLSNLGIIPPANFSLLLRLWPLALIVIGLEILIGRRSTLLSAIFGLAVVAVIVLVLVMGPALGLPPAPIPSTDTYREPVGSATSASVMLDLGSAHTTVKVLTGSNDLINANIEHLGTINFNVSGSQKKFISLSEVTNPTDWFVISAVFEELKWDIGLAPDLPIDLTINGGSGRGELDLSGLLLAGLKADVGSGAFKIHLPSSPNGYNASLNGGSGNLDLFLPSATGLSVHLEGGSGSINITIPPDAAVRIEVLNGGSGSVSIPNSFMRVSGSSDQKEGAWETAGYAQADHKILIQVVDLGSGSFSLN
jgi:hypothetical protein